MTYYEMFLPPSIGMEEDGRISTAKIQNPKKRLSVARNLKLYMAGQLCCSACYKMR